MKKTRLISLLCAIAMALTLSVPVFAMAVEAESDTVGSGRFVDLLPTGTKIIVDEPVAPEIIAAENATEFFMKPVQIDENTYEYYDEDGTLFGTFIVTSSATNQDSLDLASRAAVHTIDWRIAGNSYAHGDVELDTMGAVAEIHHTVLCLNGTTTYVGYYKPAVAEYRWLEPPFNDRLDGYFHLSASHKVNFALKNTSNFPGNYSGGYWVEF